MTSAAAQSHPSEAEVRVVQQLLIDSGFTQVAVTGKFGTTTRQAIRLYQADWSLLQTGEISSELISRLAGMHDATRSRWQSVSNFDCQIWNNQPEAEESVTWDGTCSGGKLHGRGKLEWTYRHAGQRKKATYEGGYRNGKMHGPGVYVWPDGARYEGGWKEDDYHGQGTHTWPGVGSYKGEWRNHTFHGQGVHIWAGGNRYEGKWQAGKPHGYGIFHDRKLNRTYTGQWQEGCFDGKQGTAAVETTRQACGFK